MSEMVEWCIDYLLICTEYSEERARDDTIVLRPPSFYSFVLEFLAQKLGLEKELVRNGGYD